MIRRTPPWWFNLSCLMALAGMVWIARDVGRGQATAADWLGAMATVAAFLAALLAGWYVARAYDVQLVQLKSYREEQRQSQAALVAGWWDGPSWERFDHTESGTPERTFWGLTDLVGILRNTSELPVYDVQVAVVVVYKWGSMRGEEVAGGSEFLDVLPPTASQRVQMTAISRETPLTLPDGVDRKRFRVGMLIAFVDSAGRHWVRDIGGELSGGWLSDPGSPGSADDS